MWRTKVNVLERVEAVMETTFKCRAVGVIARVMGITIIMDMERSLVLMARIAKTTTAARNPRGTFTRRCLRCFNVLSI
jgi:hypothetical protein